MTHSEQPFYIKVESIKEETDKSKETPLDPNRKVKQEPICDLEDKVITKELCGTISHPEQQFYIESTEEQEDKSKESPLNLNRNVKQNPVGNPVDQFIKKDLCPTISHPEQQFYIKIESIKEEADKSTEILLDPNRNVKQEPLGVLEDEIITKELYAAMSHYQEKPYKKIESIKEEAVKSNEKPLDPNRYVKQDPVGDVEMNQNNISAKELYATMSHPGLQYIKTQSIKEEANKSRRSCPCDPNSNGNEDPVVGPKNEIITKELYTNHEIKEEMVIGPMVLQHSAVVQARCVHCICVKVKNDAHVKKKNNCNNCEKCFKTKRGYKPAISHSEESPYKCDICNKYFKIKQYLKEHILSHTEKTNNEDHQYNRSFLGKAEHNNHLMRPYKCDICNKCFRMKRSYKLHMMAHTGESPYKCDICCKCFKTKQYLKDHMLRHTGKKLFECHHCNRSFLSKHEQNQHLMIHTDETPYKCSICNKCFKLKRYLNKHILRHTKQKLYECYHCNKSFRSKGEHSKHLMTHTYETPYKCVICNKRFKLKRYLKKHILSHTGKP